MEAVKEEKHKDSFNPMQATCSASFELCNYPHPWSDKKCNREKGHGGEHACIEHYGGRQNEWWKGKENE